MKDNNSSRKIRFSALCAVFLIVLSFMTGAVAGVGWKKGEVVPVVIVKPGIGGFEPVEGSPIGNKWSKGNVTPVVLLKPGISGFVPREGNAIGNQWNKSDVIAVMLVEPMESQFVPLRALSGTDATREAATTANSDRERATDPPAPKTLSVIESTINGEFSGWEGETVVVLSNGQIWKQSEFYYYYRYAFMPNVLIYRSGGGFKMKVDGIEKAVGVTRLK